MARRQMDLFGGEPKEPPQPTGLELGHAAAERAADHAGELWKEAAYQAFIGHAQKNKTLTIEQVRQASEGVVGEPPDRRAWGQVALRGKREKVVRRLGWVSATDPIVHGNAVTLWESLIYAPAREEMA